VRERERDGDAEIDRYIPAILSVVVKKNIVVGFFFLLLDVHVSSRRFYSSSCCSIAMEGVSTTAALAQCVAVSCSVSHLTRLPLSSRRRNWSFGTRRSKEVPGVISLPKGASSTRQVSCCSLESCRSLRRKPAVPPAVVVISPQPSSNKVWGCFALLLFKSLTAFVSYLTGFGI
jgi:hypothetical protein